MRILHLAFEDHRRPGSGGGSLRNREINSRLAARGHEIQVVTAAYAGAQTRTEDGVAYRPRGLRRGYASSLLSHQICLPGVVARAARTFRPDIIVEEFAPLTSSLGVGHWTRRPTVGVAQGFFAEEKAREYHLPKSVLTGVQRWGTRSHGHLIAVSETVASRLRAEAPGAHVRTIPNGVDLMATAHARNATPKRPDPILLYLGRLELAQKGLDLLLTAMAHVNPDARLIIAGEGRDRRALETDIRARGLEHRVETIGAVQGEAKWRLIASATVLVAPSRYETFGITPLEAMACGTAVVATDLACLRELVPSSAGVLVPAEDPRGLARAVNHLLAAPARRREMETAGPEVAAGYSWDRVAEAQLAVYEAAVRQGAHA